jgi:hypothetical protein
MAMYTDNMDEVLAADELVPEGIYHVRVSSIKEETSKQNKLMIVFDFKIQNEGVAFGRNVRVWASLDPKALFTLKSIYKAAGYNPGSGGHNPEEVMDAEMYLEVKHSMYEGRQTMNVPPYSFKSLTDNQVGRQ